MTPSEIETAARRAYNSVGNKFYGQDEILNLIYLGQIDLVNEVDMLVEKVYSTTTVIDQHEYDFPTNIHSIKRITFDGKKVDKIDFHEDDAYTLWDSDSTESGTPRLYTTFDRTIGLRPIPDTALTLKIYGYVTPQPLPTISSVIDVAPEYHGALIDYVVREMVSKDQNWPAYDRFNVRWLSHISRIKRKIQKNKRKDSFAHVKSEEMLGDWRIGGL